MPALCVSAESDGAGAMTRIDHLATGYGWKRVAEPVNACREVTEADLVACDDLGAAMASSVALGIF